MASDMSVYFVTWAVLNAKTSVESVTIDDSDGWRFQVKIYRSLHYFFGTDKKENFLIMQNIVLILVAIGLVFNGIFHAFTKEEAQELEKSGQNQSTEMTDISNDTKPTLTAAAASNSVLEMRWKDWFREKHYFQVRNFDS